MAEHPMMRWFEYKHLPMHLQAISRIFHQAATSLCEAVASCEERDVALRKLIEAKDAAVRAAIERNA
ncbi:MAG: hypothetical protein WC683_06375 [bacterium]